MRVSGVDVDANCEIGDIYEVRLWGYDDDGPNSAVKAMLFQVMLNLSITESYKGDFFHDALWIDKYVDRPVRIYFATRTYGTHIGMDRELVTLAGTSDTNHRVYEFDLQSRNGDWWVVAERIA